MSDTGQAATNPNPRPDAAAEDAVETQLALEELVKLLARAGAKASQELAISFDMGDPHVARNVLAATFDGLFCSTHRGRSGGVSRGASA